MSGQKEPNVYQQLAEQTVSAIEALKIPEEAPKQEPALDDINEAKTVAKLDEYIGVLCSILCAVKVKQMKRKANLVIMREGEAFARAKALSDGRLAEDAYRSKDLREAFTTMVPEVFVSTYDRSFTEAAVVSLSDWIYILEVKIERCRERVINLRG